MISCRRTSIFSEKARVGRCPLLPSRRRRAGLSPVRCARSPGGLGHRCPTPLTCTRRSLFLDSWRCENTRAAWQLFFTARTWAKPHRFDSSVTLLLRRVVQSKTQWHSNVLKLLKLLQKSSQASKTFFQLLQIKRLQLKLTNNLPNSYQISSQHQVPKTWVKQHPKTPNHKNKRKSISKLFHAQTGSIWFQIGSYLVPIGSYGFYSSQIGSYKLKRVSYLFTCTCIVPR